VRTETGQESVMSDGLEKRKFQRLDCPLDVAVEIVPVTEAPQQRPPLHIRSRNISKSGICLETQSIEIEGVHLLSGLPFARKHRLYMSIQLTPDEPPFEAIGEVRWYDISSDTPASIYRVGVAFLRVKKPGKEQLARFLKSHKASRGLFAPGRPF